MEKVRNYYSLQQAQKDTLFFKLKLEDILATLKEEKLQYDKVQIQKINRYEKQIESKNFLIFKLTKQLQSSKQKLDQSHKQNQNYKEIIVQLKREFFKMFEAVKKMSDPQTLAFKAQPTLKRVKSDLHKRKPKNSCMQDKESLFASPFKQVRIDINSYFLSLKEHRLAKEQITSVDEKESSKTKNSDKQMRLSSSQSFKETDCFKDLIIKEIENYPSTLSTKASNNFQATQSNNLKTTWAKKYKQNWTSTQ